MAWWNSVFRWLRIGVDAADDVVQGQPERLADDLEQTQPSASSVTDTVNAAAQRQGTAAGAAANQASHLAGKKP